MGILDFFRPSETRGDPGTLTLAEDHFGAELIRLLSNNKTITKEMVLQIPTVKACIDLIAGTIARLPVKLYRKDKDGSVVEVTDDPRTKLLNFDTGDMLSAKMFWRAIIEDYYLGKGAFVYIEKELNKVKGLYYVKEEDIGVELESIDKIKKYCTYQIMGRRYYPDEFIRFLRNTHDGYKSKSMIEENSLAFMIMYKYMQLELATADKGGIKRGFLKSQKKLAETALAKLKESFTRLYTDPNNTVIVLNDSMDFKDASMTSAELQLNDVKESGAAEIAKLFGIPPAILTGAKSNLSNALEDKKRYVGTCIALMEDLECSLNKDLLLEEEKDSFFFSFDMRELTKESLQDRYNAYKIGLESNFLQIDEVREMEELKPLGLEFLQFKLGNVFYDPKTKVVYTPNTNAAMDLSQGASFNLGDVLQGGGQGQNRSTKINLPDGSTQKINPGGDDSSKKEGEGGVEE